jgi:hypothetical protein
MQIDGSMDISSQYSDKHCNQPTSEEAKATDDALASSRLCFLRVTIARKENEHQAHRLQKRAAGRSMLGCSIGTNKCAEPKVDATNRTGSENTSSQCFPKVVHSLIISASFFDEDKFAPRPSRLLPF